MMTDPYLYPNSNILINKYHIKDIDTLKQMEAEFTSFRIKQIVQTPLTGDYDFVHLCSIHYHIFQDIYDWAGKPRTINIEKPEPVLGGLSIEYASFDEIESLANDTIDKMNDIKWRSLDAKTSAVLFSKYLAMLWKNHFFRDGNTRAVVTFCCDLVEHYGLYIDRSLFQRNSNYLRDALVAASAIFSDLGDLSKPEYLIEIVSDSIIDL